MTPTIRFGAYALGVGIAGGLFTAIWWGKNPTDDATGDTAFAAFVAALMWPISVPWVGCFYALRGIRAYVALQHARWEDEQRILQEDREEQRRLDRIEQEEIRKIAREL